MMYKLFSFFIYIGNSQWYSNHVFCSSHVGNGGQVHYGKQRVWGTVGFGVSALIGGYLIDLWSGESNVKDYTPAFVLSIFLTGIDLFCCSKLKVSHFILELTFL